MSFLAEQNIKKNFWKEVYINVHYLVNWDELKFISVFDSWYLILLNLYWTHNIPL